MADEPVCPWQIDVKARCPVHGGPLEMCPMNPADEHAETIQELISFFYKRAR